MTTETILTDAQIIGILEENRPEYDGLDKAIAVSRAIEQAVLQSLPVLTSSAIRGDSYAGVYVWIGDENIVQHIPKVLAQTANDPQSILGVVASECIKKLERHNVLQSPEIQALRKDAERYRVLRQAIRPYGFTVLVRGYDLCTEELDSAVDAAMEQQT